MNIPAMQVGKEGKVGSVLSPSPIAQWILDLSEQQPSAAVGFGSRLLIFSDATCFSVTPARGDERLWTRLQALGVLPGTLSQQTLSQVNVEDESALRHFLMSQKLVPRAELAHILTNLWVERSIRSIAEEEQSRSKAVVAATHAAEPTPPGVPVLTLVLESLRARSASLFPEAVLHEGQMLQWLDSPHVTEASKWCNLPLSPDALRHTMSEDPPAIHRAIAVVRAGVARLAAAQAAPAPPRRPHSSVLLRPSWSPSTSCALDEEPLTADELDFPLKLQQLGAPEMLPYQGSLNDPLEEDENKVAVLEQQARPGHQRAAIWKRLGRTWRGRFLCLEEASRCFREAVAADPEDSEALRLASYSCAALGEDVLARQYARAWCCAAEERDDAVKAHLFAATLAARQADRGRALQALRRVTELDGRARYLELMSFTLNGYDYRYEAQSFAVKAVKGWSKVDRRRARSLAYWLWENNQGDPRCVQVLAETLLDSGLVEAAIYVTACTARRVEHLAPAVELYSQAASVAEEYARPDLAGDLWLEALRRSPRDEFILGRAVDAYSRAGECIEAALILELHAHPFAAATRTQMCLEAARLWHKLGDDELALMLSLEAMTGPRPDVSAAATLIRRVCATLGSRRYYATLERAARLQKDPEAQREIQAHLEALSGSTGATELAEAIPVFDPVISQCDLPEALRMADALWSQLRDAELLRLLEQVSALPLGKAEQLGLIRRRIALELAIRPSAGAASLLRKAMRLEPQNAKMVQRLRHMALLNGDPALSREAAHLRTQLVAAPQVKARAYADLARLLTPDRPDEALLHATTALKTDPRNAEAAALVLAHSTRLGTKPALERIDRIRRVFGSSPQVLRSLQRMAEESGEVQTHVEASSALHQLLPYDQAAAHTYARAIERYGTTEQMKKVVQEMLNQPRIDAVDASTFEAIAARLAREGEGSAAAELLFRLWLKEGHRSEQLLSLLTACVRETGSVDLMIRLREVELSGEEPPRSKQLAQLGHLHLERGEVAAQARMYLRVLAVDAKNTEALEELTQIYARSRNFLRLSAVLGLLYEGAPTAEEKLQRVTCLALTFHTHLGDTPSALRSVHRWLDQPEASTTFAAESAALLVSLGEVERAVHWLRNARANVPSSRAAELSVLASRLAFEKLQNVPLALRLCAEGDVGASSAICDAWLQYLMHYLQSRGLSRHRLLALIEELPSQDLRDRVVCATEGSVRPPSRAGRADSGVHLRAVSESGSPHPSQKTLSPSQKTLSPSQRAELLRQVETLDLTPQTSQFLLDSIASPTFASLEAVPPSILRCVNQRRAQLQMHPLLRALKLLYTTSGVPLPLAAEPPAPACKAPTHATWVAAAEVVASRVDAPALAVKFVSGGDGLCQFYPAKPPVLLVPTGSTPTAEQQAAAGMALEAAREAHLLLAVLPPASLHQLLEGVRAAFSAPDDLPRLTAEAAEVASALWRDVPPKQQRALRDAVLEWDVLEWEELSAPLLGHLRRELAALRLCAGWIACTSLSAVWSAAFGVLLPEGEDERADVLACALTMISEGLEAPDAPAASRAR